MRSFFDFIFRFGFLLAIATSLVQSSAVDLKPSHAPIVLNPGPHLFLDEFLVESSSNVVRRVNPPVRNPAIANPTVTVARMKIFSRISA